MNYFMVTFSQENAVSHISRLLTFFCRLWFEFRSVYLFFQTHAKFFSEVIYSRSCFNFVVRMHLQKRIINVKWLGFSLPYALIVYTSMMPQFHFTGISGIACSYKYAEFLSQIHANRSLTRAYSMILTKKVTFHRNRKILQENIFY